LGTRKPSPKCPSVTPSRCYESGHPSGYRWPVVAVSVLLADSEHMCCGERRAVGDAVTIKVQIFEGTIYEERHGDGVGVDTQPISGIVSAIQWRPAIMLREGDYAMKLIGYEPGLPVESTDYEDPVETHWAFEFTIETDGSVPLPREAV
jgi:hypothetical protein